MKDLCARKEIAELRSTVFGLKNIIDNLKCELDSRTHLKNDSYWDYGIGNTFFYHYPIRDVLDLLLSYFGLKLETQKTEEKIVLRKIEDKK